MVGRTGVTVCGLPGVVDQERASHLMGRWNPRRNIKIHELRPCQRCHQFIKNSIRLT